MKTVQVTIGGFLIKGIFELERSSLMASVRLVASAGILANCLGPSDMH